MKGSRPLTTSEVDAVLESFTGRHATRDKALFVLGIKSGFRVSEILSLRIGDVWQGGAPVNRVYVARRNMKRKAEGRCVILHPQAKAALTDWIAELREQGRADPECVVFQSQKDTSRPISRVQAYRVLRRAYDKNEMQGQLGTHSMRKTFADRVYDHLDHDLVKTQRALGHKNINSTVSYLSFREEEIDQAILAI